MKRIRNSNNQSIKNPNNINTWSISDLIDKCVELGIKPPTSCLKASLVFAIHAEMRNPRK